MVTDHSIYHQNWLQPPAQIAVQLGIQMALIYTEDSWGRPGFDVGDET